MKRLSDALHPGARVFVPGVSGESALWIDDLRADPERARGVHFIGVQFPGIDSADYLALHSDTRLTAFFMSPAVREGIRQGRAEVLAPHYPGLARHLRDLPPGDRPGAQLSPPRARG